MTLVLNLKKHAPLGANLHPEVISDLVQFDIGTVGRGPTLMATPNQYSCTPLLPEYCQFEIRYQLVDNNG